MTTFGLQIPNFRHEGVDNAHLFDSVCAYAAAAEATGFESVWVMDHFWQLPALGGPDEPILEAYTLLGALAARTNRVTLGTLVTGVTYRNPALLAKMVTTLDIVSGGRAVLGIGAAWYDPEHEGFGYEFPPVKERLDRLEEAVQICRAMFRDDKPTFTGRYYRIAEARNVPRPVQPGGPPIMIGGGGERRTLKLVAQYADMCNVSGGIDMINHKLSVLREHCTVVGRDFGDITTTRLGTLVLTPDSDETARVHTFLGGLMGADYREQFTIGEPDDIVREVEALAATGIDTLIFNMPLSDVDSVTRVGELLVSRFGS
ncbi:MAG: LLM class F420-dependent oxidoreductase [Actinomycetota bacterium]|nr:LLM class F420-dependent oxidoreductase [Actinomycetota bacterium]